MAFRPLGFGFELKTPLGLAESNPWLWVASIAIPAVVTGVVLVVVSRARAAHDERERIRLKLV